MDENILLALDAIKTVILLLLTELAVKATRIKKAYL
jgi:hypothetical protein